ncbi:MAG TPA: helix-turn-helix transcriptional regulator [Mycobacteriales bacterium]|nr:helix-turn-helix transcriptional regulator [Mycobacteriales bacterium]
MALVGEPREPRIKRRQLAAELRRLREAAGVSGRGLAERIGISQSKVSRIESGAAMPSVPQVAAWVDAIGASAETRARLTALTESAFAEVQAWRAVVPDRAGLQSQIQEHEAAARTVRVFQPFLVPGLLQTAEYARRVFGFFHLPYDEGDLARAVAGRIDRQLALYEEDRQFAFLITEAALRWRPGPPRILRAQLDRIASLATLSNVSIGFIPSDIEASMVITPGFDILRDQDSEVIVTIETMHANLVVADPGHVAEYEQAWSGLSRMAVFGHEARQLLENIRDASSEYAD